MNRIDKNSFFMWIAGFGIVALFALIGVVFHGHVKADEVQAREIKANQVQLAEKADRKEIEEKLATLGKDVGTIKTDLAKLVGYIEGVKEGK